MKSCNKLFTFILLLVGVFSQLHSQELKLSAIFGDNMVLQQKTETPIWGYDKANTKVNISTSWDGKQYNVTTDKEGKWKIMVSTFEAGGPYTIIVSGSETITLNNVYLGEVWLASGQSNMSMPLKGYKHQPVIGSNNAILKSKGKKIHFVNIPIMAAYKEKDDLEKTEWLSASPENIGECSAVCWFFADMLNEQLNVPIGIINASYGGSIVEAWMSETACKQFGKDIWIPEKSDETSPWINNVPTLLYNGMIYPLIGYGIKGLLWYQGESNIFNVPPYALWVAAMVVDWRKQWQQKEDFAFYFVQIAPYDYKQWNFFTPQQPHISAYLREAQRRSLDLIPNSGMAVGLDLGEEFQIHPSRKKEVGERLAFLALGKTYGEKGFEYESPQYEYMDVEGEKAIIHFSKQNMGLTSFGKEMTLFEIAGENRVFHKAKAIIDEKIGAVVVTNPLVKEPKAVRYAFKDYVEAELFGTGGLPVSSFRTDDW
jgi:sialate O-acetylesterase